jgi:hypothetical protein
MMDEAEDNGVEGAGSGSSVGCSESGEIVPPQDEQNRLSPETVALHFGH